MRKNPKKAFSLVELSIVILIIGVLIAGVTQSTSLVRKFRLQTAQNLTTNSPVASIQNLVAWYETSLEQSFTNSEESDGLTLSTWYDTNPQSTTKNNVTQGTTTNKPKFYENVFGAIPSVRFDGVDNFLSLDDSLFLQTNYTIFIVEQRRDGDDYNYFFGGNSNSDYNNLHIGYRSNTQIKFDHYGSGFGSAIFPTYSSVIPRIHTFWFSQTAGQKYYTNGGANPDAADATKTGALTAYPGSKIGRYKGGSLDEYYNGDMGEIIIFNRALNAEERTAVESYLGKKFNITIS